MGRRANWSLVRRVALGIVATLVVMVTLPTAPVEAQVPPAGVDPDAVSILLLVDVSSSMSEDDGTGRVRIDGAKTALREFLAEVPDQAQVGLRVFPAPGSSCGPGARLSPVSPLDRTAIRAAVDSLSPSGDTPTAEALLAAGEDLEATTRYREIVLVSDGESNCGADPCPVARDLAAKGLNFSINTLGFQISDAGRQQLECIASVTGGRYRDVEDSQELAEEMGALTQPQLAVNIDSPQELLFPVDIRGAQPLSFEAVVTDVGARDALDVVVDLEIEGVDVRPDDRRRRLGNVRAGEKVKMPFTIEVPEPREASEIEIVITARGSGVEASKKATVRLVPGEFTLKARGGPVLRNVRSVAIMGDSYSAGEGAGNYLPGTDTSSNGCHRSNGTYGRGPGGKELFPGGRTILACSGAVTTDIYRAHPDHAAIGGRGKLPSQIEQLRALPPQDAVWMTIGGNDVRFADVIMECIKWADKCSEEVKDNEGEKIVGPLLGGLSASLLEVYRSVHSELNSAANHSQRQRWAPIVVLAYPKLLSADPGTQARCKWLSPAEVRWANRMAERLNDVIRTTVDQARGAGIPVYFAPSVEGVFLPDLVNGLSGHTLCDSLPYVNGLKVLAGLSAGAVNFSDGIIRRRVFGPFEALLPPSPTPAEVREYKESFHPNEFGYSAFTRAVLNDARDWKPVAEPLPPGPRINVTNRPPVIDLNSLQGGSSAELLAGGAFDVVASGFAPQSSVSVVLRSEPQVVGVGTADDDGRAVVPIYIGRSTPGGDHHLEAVGIDDDGDERVVGAPASVGTPGRAILPLVGIGASALMLLVGAFLIWRAARALAATASEPPPTRSRRAFRRRRSPGDTER